MSDDEAARPSPRSMLFVGSGVCRCEHDKGAHTRQVNDDGSCTACGCVGFVDQLDAGS